jgi:hypothetical protein
MSNWIAMRLDVLAPNPEEINKIEAALQQPCQELLEGVAEDIRSIVRFTPVGNLGFLDPSSNTARQFQNRWKDRRTKLVCSHLYFISRDFPDSIFLADYWDTTMDYGGKVVIRAGREIRSVYDGDRQAQGCAWVLPDIFIPYKAEYFNHAEFGLYWDAWLIAMEGALAKLKERYGVPEAGTTCQSALLEWERKFEMAAEFIEHNEETEERDI